jgi:hypothetical protein
MGSPRKKYAINVWKITIGLLTCERPPEYLATRQSRPDEASLDGADFPEIMRIAVISRQYKPAILPATPNRICAVSESVIDLKARRRNLICLPSSQSRSRKLIGDRNGGREDCPRILAHILADFHPRLMWENMIQWAMERPK